MFARQCLTVLATLALAASARAAPGANDILQEPPKGFRRGDSLPVNEQFPSAVLFGPNCGGTIISPTWILTAAHCTLYTGPRARFVVAGTNSTFYGNGIRRSVKRQVIHPLFTVGPYWVDAAQFGIKQVGARWDFLLVELNEPLPLNGKTIAAAPLYDEPSLPAGLDVGYAGYGTDHFGGTMTHEMHGMKLSVQSDQTCYKLKQYNSKDMMCAKGRPPQFDSACSGDSGSGLVDATGRLVGVVSWVENDAIECFPGALVVCARVSAAIPWIRHVTNLQLA